MVLFFFSDDEPFILQRWWSAPLWQIAPWAYSNGFYNGVIRGEAKSDRSLEALGLQVATFVSKVGLGVGVRRVQSYRTGARRYDWSPWASLRPIEQVGLSCQLSMAR